MAPLFSLYPPSAASVSKSETSKDHGLSKADEMLRASLSGDAIASNSSESVSRSALGSDADPSVESKLRASPSESISSHPPAASASVSTSRSMSRHDPGPSADEMLRLSLSGGVMSPSSSASVSRSTLRSEKKSAPNEVLRRSLASACDIPSAPDTSTHTVAPPSYSSLYISLSNEEPVPVGSTKTTDSIKLRKLQLQEETDKANAAAIRRDTVGLFKAACSTDLLFLIDATSSMRPYIDAAKQQVRNIVADIKEAFLNESQVRIAVVCYRDHDEKPNIEFLDFTTSAKEVSNFLDTISAVGGRDIPEDVLGGINQALQASWKLETRCMIHIADAPPHGDILHDLSASKDNYYEIGSEPHRLTYEPLIRKLVQIKANYVLLRINKSTDRMALAFAGVYGHENAKLLTDNKYHSEIESSKSSDSRLTTTNKHLGYAPQFEESNLGTTYNELRHLVVHSVTTSVSRTAGRLSVVLSRDRKPTKGKLTSALAAVSEDETTLRSKTGKGGTQIKHDLERGPAKWTTPGWLDDRLEVDGFCPAVIVHNANTLGDMMAGDDNIKLSTVELTIYARSKPFAKGALRLASYAKTAASTSPFVIKSFIEAGHGRADVAEDMRIQALCKAFALEFNSLLKVEPPLDFLVTSCLQTRSTATSGSVKDCLSLEPFIEGDYVKYNNNAGYVNESDSRFNQIAQAFSHFTFERSWGYFLINDLQGVGHLLTDPSIQTHDIDRFKLNETNLRTEGFKFFFATHKCNRYCERLKLESNRRMFISNEWKFRKRWPTMDPTVCCSNMLCRNIIRLASARQSDKFRDKYWCDKCWPQLQEFTATWICAKPGPTHEFEVSRFFHESQGESPPKMCPKHRAKDASESSPAAVGSKIWGKMTANSKKGTISGKGW